MAECEAILEGRPGRTIFGVDLEGSGPALPIELVAGSNTQLSTETAWQQIHATCDGGVALTSTIARDKAGVIAGRAYHFSVLPVVHLSDVGYESGHVDFQGHVVVKGSRRIFTNHPGRTLKHEKHLVSFQEKPVGTNAVLSSVHPSFACR